MANLIMEYVSKVAIKLNNQCNCRKSCVKKNRSTFHNYFGSSGLFPPRFVQNHPIMGQNRYLPTSKNMLRYSVKTFQKHVIGDELYILRSRFSILNFVSRIFVNYVANFEKTPKIGVQHT